MTTAPALRRILVSAYACEPGKGSEQGVGWNWCRELARYAQVVVLTRSNNRAAIEGTPEGRHTPQLRFEYYDLPDCIRRIKRKERGLYPYYLLWQYGAYRRARALCRAQHFDYVMHLTFGSIWLPTLMYRLPVPFIWGPVGGGEAVPWPLVSTLPVAARATQYLRHLLMATLPINPLVMPIVRRACRVIARTTDTARLIPEAYRDKVRVELETGVAGDWLQPVCRATQPLEPPVLRVIYSGRLIAIKNVSAALEAFALARRRGCRLRLVIVGDGPLRIPLQQLAVRLGVAAEVEFLGQIEQRAVIEELRRSDIYLFPSLKEGGVWSLIEAMSVGLPVICVNGSGMAEITDEHSAIRIAASSRASMIAQFAQALAELSASPERRDALANNARRRVEERLQWGEKGKFMRALLDELEVPAK